ncbi:hypothetical protein [Azoarcus indigens]|nr:hypothetical protein [Azoarcus indigens]
MIVQKGEGFKAEVIDSDPATVSPAMRVPYRAAVAGIRIPSRPPAVRPVR